MLNNKEYILKFANDLIDYGLIDVNNYTEKELLNIINQILEYVSISSNIASNITNK